MADSVEVLSALKLVYTIYALLAISLIGRFAYVVADTTDTQKSESSSKAFWSYVVVLAIIGMGMHFLTYNVVPWVKTDLNRSSITPVKTFEINYQNHTMTFSERPMMVPCDQYVVFNAKSSDLTYGFGIFRKNNSMVAQMQVVPLHNNDLMWKFSKNGIYSVRSTEYSGPKGGNMLEKDILIVTGCSETDPHSAENQGV